MRFVLMMMMVGILSAQVKINEVYYDSPTGQGNEPYIEWIELYNAGEEPINLNNWVISDDPDPQDPGSEGAFVFPELTLNGHEFLLLLYDADTFTAYFGSIPTQYAVYGEDAPTLKMGNSGEDLHLFDSELNGVDAMWYGNGGDLDTVDAAPDVPAGHSLGRVPDGTDTDVPQSDFEDLETPSPGATNATLVNESGYVDRKKASIDFWPSLASDKVLFLSKDGRSISVKIRTLDGRTVRCLRGTNKIEWIPDLPQGLYLVSVRNTLGQEINRPLLLLRK